MKKYDAIVIGSGSGGLTCAYTAKGLGKRVLLIDKNKPGGECTWSGCIPSKSLIHVAKEIAIARKYNAELEVSYASVLDRVRGIREGVYVHESPDVLQSEGIDYIQGFASFERPGIVRVEDEVFEGTKIFITTGSSPFIPPIEGISNVRYHTNDTLFDAKTLKGSMVVLGGGPIGVELAMAMNDLGIRVDIVEMADRLLIREEEVLSEKLMATMTEKGIRVHCGVKATAVTESENKILLTVESGQGSQLLTSDELLVAVGRKPNTEGLSLEKSNIKYTKRGIVVDEYLRTTNKSVYAVGDVAGPYQFSHMAFTQGILAVQNAFLPWKRKISYRHVPWCTYTSPELGRTGLTEAEAVEKYGNGVKSYVHEYDRIDRARTEEATDGLIKLVVHPNGKLLGASILGERAGELIGEVQVVKTLGLKVTDLAKVIHPYPTYAEALATLGRNILVERLVNHPVVKLFRK